MLSPKEVDENNEKLAKFLGWYQEDDERDTWWEVMGHAIYVACRSTRDMKFHESLDALLPVLNKIESLNSNNGLKLYHVYITSDLTAIERNMIRGFMSSVVVRRMSTNNIIENTWLCFVDFVDWYDENYGDGKSIQETT